MINELKLLANQQNDGDSPVWMIVPGEKSAKRSDGLRLFVAADNYAAVNVGIWRKKRGQRRW